MSDLFRVYNLTTKNRDVKAMLDDYIKRHGKPPEIVRINKNDSESELPEGLKVVVSRWVLPKHLYFEVPEADNEA